MKTLRFQLVAVMALLAVAGPLWAQNRPAYVPDELLVRFHDGVTMVQVADVLDSIGARIQKKYRLTPTYRLRVVGDMDLPQRKALLSRRPEVAYVEFNYYRYFDRIPGDPRFPEMWGLDNTGQTGGTVDADIDAAEAWEVTTGDPGLVIAVIDSGLDMTHADLAANVWTNADETPGNGIDDDGNGYVDDVHGWDFSGNDNDPSDDIAICMGHGTHTAGTIGAVGDNATGVTGINWNVKIMPLKTAKRVLIFCSLEDADIIDAIEYAAANGAMLSNNSYGGGGYNQAVADAIRASRRLFVAAAGNDGSNNDATPSYPASYPLPNIISVAATDHNDRLAAFSNFGGNSVDLGAPGVSILSTLPNDKYGTNDGTSMASPHVAGAAGLLLANDPGLTPNELRWRLLTSTDNIGIPVATAGRLNVNAALTLPAPSIAIDVAPLGPTAVSPANPIDYRVTLVNTTGASRQVSASVLAVTPDGTEIELVSRVLNLGAGLSVSGDFSVMVPAGAAAGEYYLLGRADVAGVSFDEDRIIYTIMP